MIRSARQGSSRLLATLSTGRRGTVRRPLAVLGLILVAVLVVDLAATAAVYVDRRNDPLAPSFVRADVSALTWDQDVYRDPAPVLRLTTTPDAPARVDARGHVSFPDGVLRPDASLRYALGALDRFDKTGERVWLRRAETSVTDVLATLDGGLIPHDFATKDIIGVDVPAPWFSGDTQGLMLSALSRLSARTGESRWRAPANEVFGALASFKNFLVGDRPVPKYWLTSVDGAGYLWFDRFSSDLRTYSILNNQLWTLLGIYDYRRSLAHRGTWRTQATHLFAGGLATVQHYLESYRDPGRISIDSLVAKNHDMGAHFLAVAQLHALARVTRDPTVVRYADIFDRDDDVPFFPVTGPDLNDDVDPYQPLPADIATEGGRDRPQRVTTTGVPTEGPGVLDPTRNAAFVLAALAEHRRTGDPRWLTRATSAADEALATAEDGALPYRYRTHALFGAPVTGTWYSAEGQGLMLSALSQLFTATGDERWRREAGAVATALTQVRGYDFPPPDPWLALLDDGGYVWFEQYAGANAPSQAIMGQLTAVLGLYDYWRISKDRRAYFFFRGGAATVKTQLAALRAKSVPVLTTILGGKRDARSEQQMVQDVDALARITDDRTLVRAAALLAKDYGR
jgi:hypothetical protein